MGFPLVKARLSEGERGAEGRTPRAAAIAHRAPGAGEPSSSGGSRIRAAGNSVHGPRHWPSLGGTHTEGRGGSRRRGVRGAPPRRPRALDRDGEPEVPPASSGDPCSATSGFGKHCDVGTHWRLACKGEKSL